MPWRLTSGSGGRRPTRLPAAVGPRTDPPVSWPMPTVAKFAATPAPVPPDDPLGWRVGSYGFRIGPDIDPAYPEANSPIVAFPMMMAPASRSLFTTVASRAGMKSLNTADPYVVTM